MKPPSFQLWIIGYFVLLCPLSSAEPPWLVDARKQLHDPLPSVRKQAALALAESHHADAIPILIDLLAELSTDESRPVEEFLRELAGEGAPIPQPSGDGKTARKMRREVWKMWWRKSDGESLLAIVRENTLTPERDRKVKELIAKLGDDQFSLREAAEKELLHLGRLALPPLRAAIANKDLEVSLRARRLIERLEQEPARHLAAAAVRLLALRKPQGAVEALLAYLPFAEEEKCLEDVKESLAALAVRDGQLDTALMRSTADKRPAVRAATAEALVKGGGGQGRAAVFKLLRDEDPTARLRVALALAKAGEKDAVPVLIDLLAVLADEQVCETEATLHQLAGDTAPETPWSIEPVERKKCRDVWTAWWKANANRVDLARVGTHSRLGYTLICDNGVGRGNGIGCVFEIDRYGKKRWSIGGLQIPIDAVVLPGNRVLISEFRGNRVTERDLQGHILWQKRIAAPLNVQRLPNGHTFIATNGGSIVEVDRAGKETYSIKNVPGKVIAAYRWHRGDIVCMTADGQCHLLDTTGKELKKFAAGHDANSCCCLDLKPNGHILITRFVAGEVVEFDREGKVLLKLNMPGVACASQSSNGRILVPEYQNQRVYERDRAGKIIWEYKGDGHFIRARRR